MKRERELLEKVKEWQTKADSETDPFNKYVSLFTAYNIFYNLYAKKKDMSPNTDFVFGDSKRDTDTISLIDVDQLFPLIESDLKEYLSIIPIFREEYWKMRNARVPISQRLKASFEAKNKAQAIDLLIKWLYKVRCNLVHGEKSYHDTYQKRLLEISSVFLDRILRHLVSRYEQIYGRGLKSISRMLMRLHPLEYS